MRIFPQTLKILKIQWFRIKLELTLVMQANTQDVTINLIPIDGKEVQFIDDYRDRHHTFEVWTLILISRFLTSKFLKGTYVKVRKLLIRVRPIH